MGAKQHSAEQHSELGENVRDAAEQGADAATRVTSSVQEPVHGTALSVRPHRRTLYLLAAGVASTALAVLAGLLARRRNR